MRPKRSKQKKAARLQGVDLSSTSSMRLVFAWVPALSWAALIFWLSTRPSDGTTPPWWFPHADKVIHLILFGLLSILIAFAFRTAHRWGKRKAACAALVLTVLYGCSDEWHQRATPGRSSDPWDIAADAVGGLAAFLPLHRRDAAT